jgi:hypothetical protein
MEGSALFSRPTKSTGFRGRWGGQLPVALPFRFNYFPFVFYLPLNLLCFYSLAMLQLTFQIFFEFLVNFNHLK